MGNIIFIHPCPLYLKENDLFGSIDCSLDLSADPLKRETSAFNFDDFDSPRGAKRIKLYQFGWRRLLSSPKLFINARQLYIGNNGNCED